MSTANATQAALGTLAINSAIAAVKNDDKATHTAIVALSLVMASRQIDRAEQSEDITEKANKATFRAFLKVYASRGGMVWRDTQTAIDAITAKRGKERDKLASDYIDKKAKDSRMVDGLARLRTWSFRLMKDVCTNHAGILGTMLATRQSGASADALVEQFRSFVNETYGSSFAALSASLAEEKQKKTVNVIDSIMKRAEEMADSDLAILVARLQSLYVERQTTAAEVAAAFESAGPVGQADAMAIESELDRRIEAEAVAA